MKRRHDHFGIDFSFTYEEGHVSSIRFRKKDAYV